MNIFKKKFIIGIIILVIICFTSCSRTTTFSREEKVIWEINSQSDSIVSYKRIEEVDGKVTEEYKVDNSGGPNVFESATSNMLMRTNINVGGD